MPLSFVKDGAASQRRRMAATTLECAPQAQLPRKPSVPLAGTQPVQLSNNSVVLDANGLTTQSNMDAIRLLTASIPPASGLVRGDLLAQGPNLLANFKLSATESGAAAINKTAVDPKLARLILAALSPMYASQVIKVMNLDASSINFATIERRFFEAKVATIEKLKSVVAHSGVQGIVNILQVGPQYMNFAWAFAGRLATFVMSRGREPPLPNVPKRQQRLQQHVAIASEFTASDYWPFP
mmetsp:Transcript_16100/g.48909  ORF Transcript_16100/g.48909 Transcript_16100/m.48909 type:complete len:240 (-) Transcript_16100:155-874(-)|eukprot:scaffold261377_cov29-Tisochrysis_lutea.AAC.2